MHMVFVDVHRGLGFAVAGADTQNLTPVPIEGDYAVDRYLLSKDLEDVHAANL